MPGFSASSFSVGRFFRNVLQLRHNDHADLVRLRGRAGERVPAWHGSEALTGEVLRDVPDSARLRGQASACPSGHGRDLQACEVLREAGLIPTSSKARSLMLAVLIEAQQGSLTQVILVELSHDELS